MKKKRRGRREEANEGDKNDGGKTAKKRRKKEEEKNVEPLLASRNIFSSGCSSVRSVQPLPENSKRLPS